MRKIFILQLVVLSINGFSQNLEEYQRKSFMQGSQLLPYRILMPQNFDNTKSYPLIIFLHGAYSKGNNNEEQLGIGAKYFLRKNNRDSFPAIVIFPQCPVYDSWAEFDMVLDSISRQIKAVFPFKRQPTEISQTLMLLIDSIRLLPFVNKKQVYIAGLSQGGMGVLDLIARYPDVFAAGLSICGAGAGKTVKRFSGKVALWLFHGDSDDVVPVTFSRDFYKRLKRENADVRYSEYNNVYHDSWVNAFKEPDLLPWLFSKKKQQ